MKNSISDIIERRIIHQKHGRIIFQSDFRGIGSAAAINISLARLTNRGLIRRLAHGIYYKPKKDSIFGELSPSVEEIAEAIAIKEHINIRPAGLYALHKLGISTQVPTKLIYLTDGQRRKLIIGNTELNFKPTTAKKMALKGPLSSLVIQVIEELGTSNLSEHIEAKLKDCLENENPAYLKTDLALAPAFVYDYILKLLKQ